MIGGDIMQAEMPDDMDWISKYAAPYEVRTLLSSKRCDKIEGMQSLQRKKINMSCFDWAHNTKRMSDMFYSFKMHQKLMSFLTLSEISRKEDE